MMNETINLPALVKAMELMRGVERRVMQTMRAYSEKSPEVVDALHPIAQDAAEAKNLLLTQGIGQKALPPRNAFAELDTENSRLLYKILDNALLVANDVDKERGHAYDDQGTDYAPVVAILLNRLRAELEPPKGRD